MSDKDKTKGQLVSELEEMRQRVAVLEKSEVKHKQAEKILPLPAEDYQKLFELFPTGVTILDMKGVILYCNSAVYNKGGYTEDEFTGKHFSKIAPLRVKDIPTYIRVFNSIVRGKIPQPFEITYQRKDGATGWSELGISLIKVGGKQRILVTQHDITDRKKKGEQVYVANERLQYLLSASPAVIYTARPSGNYGATFISENVSKTVGYEPQEFTKDSSFWVDHVHRDDLQKVYDAVTLLFENSYGAYEYRFKHRNGNYIWIRDEMRLIRDEKGNPIEIVGYWADITESKEAEEALRESEERLRFHAEKSPMGVVEWGSDFIVTRWTGEASNIFGWTAEEVIGKPIMDLHMIYE